MTLIFALFALLLCERVSGLLRRVGRALLGGAGQGDAGRHEQGGDAESLC